jgi:dienelactone hydrolase
MLDKAGMATLLIDLLTPEEGQIDDVTRRLRFDINLLTERLVGIVDWLAADSRTENLSVGLFGASTGAAGALRAAAQRPGMVRAVVSRGGRPDMAENALPLVEAPTLLIVGGRDNQVIQLNEQAFEQMEAAVKEMRIVPGAGHLFEEPGALEMVVEHAREWFERYLLGMDG